MIVSQEKSIVCACRDNSIKIISKNNIFNYPIPEIAQEQKNKNKTTDENYIKALCLSSGEKHLITGDRWCFVRVWDFKNIKLPLFESKNHLDSISCLILNPNCSSEVISGSYDHNIIIWDYEENKIKSTLKKHHDWVMSLETSKDHNDFLFSGGADKMINIWNINTYDLIFQLEGHTNFVSSLKKISSDILLSGGYDLSIKFGV